MEKLFKYNESNVRTEVNENGDYWFSGKDICNILEYADSTQAIMSLDEVDRKLDRVRDGSGQSRKAWTVNEAGLYSLIFSSSKPEAKAFKNWVTHDVLPSLRKAGKYTSEAVAAKDTKIQDIIKRIESKEKDLTDSKTTTKKLEREINMLQVELRMVLKNDPSQTEVYPPEVWGELKNPLKEDKND